MEILKKSELLLSSYIEAVTWSDVFFGKRQRRHDLGPIVLGTPCGLVWTHPLVRQQRMVASNQIKSWQEETITVLSFCTARVQIVGLTDMDGGAWSG